MNEGKKARPITSLSLGPPLLGAPKACKFAHPRCPDLNWHLRTPSRGTPWASLGIGHGHWLFRPWQTNNTPALSAMPTLSPTAASAADAGHAALHTTASGVPNEHVSRLRQWFCSCASTTITPAAERIKWYGKQTNCCIGSTERPQRAPARALTLMTMDEDNCSCFFDELGRCNGL